mmetsp:Transcript_19729/g.50082  ORF Transcript_19729/g.50082 Transcript_19729/m.50082 type:complete len:298 (-) Transcript_19729:415-1308(-)
MMLGWLSWRSRPTSFSRWSSSGMSANASMSTTFTAKRCSRLGSAPSNTWQNDPSPSSRPISYFSRTFSLMTPISSQLNTGGSNSSSSFFRSFSFFFIFSCSFFSSLNAFIRAFSSDLSFRRSSFIFFFSSSLSDVSLICSSFIFFFISSFASFSFSFSELSFVSLVMDVLDTFIALCDLIFFIFSKPKRLVRFPSSDLVRSSDDADMAWAGAETVSGLDGSELYAEMSAVVLLPVVDSWSPPSASASASVVVVVVMAAGRARADRRAGLCKSRVNDCDCTMPTNSAASPPNALSNAL